MYFYEYNWKEIFDSKGNFLGNITNILFDKDCEKVIWFIFKKSFLSYSFFLIEDVIIKNKIILKIEWNKEIKNKNIYEIINKTVKNENLDNIWVVEDIEFDSRYKLKNLIVNSGLNYSYAKLKNKKHFFISKNVRKISRSKILSYNDNYIIIEDKNFIKKDKKTLEKLSKIFINIPRLNYNINKGIKLCLEKIKE